VSAFSSRDYTPLKDRHLNPQVTSLISLPISLSHLVKDLSNRHSIAFSSAAIPIIFGILSVCISLVGVLIAYLSYRAMIREHRMYICPVNAMRPISRIMELTVSFQQTELVETRQVTMPSTTNTSISSHRPTLQDQPMLQGQLTSSNSYQRPQERFRS
jgi:hypothetical protein